MRDRDWKLAIVFATINGIVLYNAILHEPTIQYDSRGHLHYIQALSKFHLPSPKESIEFFCPPIPYLIPAIAHASGLTLWWSAKIGQLTNVILSIGVTVGLISLCRAMRPGDRKLPLIALMGLGCLPVYYKTMAFVRGEPYVVFLTIVSVLATVRALTSVENPAYRASLAGLSWGLLALTRQWGLLSIGGMLIVVCLVARSGDRRKLAICLAIPLIALLVAGWFYGWLWTQHESAIAFNRKPHKEWSLSHHPARFYVGTGNGRLLTDPIRPSFPNQIGPIFYAETWGDYWGYFSVFGRDRHTGRYSVGPGFQRRVAEQPSTLDTNRYEINSKLGRIGLVGILPTALALIAFIAATMKLPSLLNRDSPLNTAEIIPAMATLIILVSITGYLWFLIRFPNPGNGDTIKATYMLHAFPLLGLLTAEFVRRARVPSTIWLLAWAVLMLHSIPAMTTHFPNIAR